MNNHNYFTNLTLLPIILLYLLKINANDNSRVLNVFYNDETKYNRKLHQVALESLPSCPDPNIEPKNYSCDCIEYDRNTIERTSSVTITSYYLNVYKVCLDNKIWYTQLLSHL